MTSVAQNDSSDLMHAMKYSKDAVNASTNESAAYLAAKAFYDTEESDEQAWNNHKAKLKTNQKTHQQNNSKNITGVTVKRSSSERNRAATNMSKVGLQRRSSGLNKGEEISRRYAEQRAERARLAAERRERMVASYMAQINAVSQGRVEGLRFYIYENAHTKPLSPEQAYNLMANGLPGNLIIVDENNEQYKMPEALLEGSGESHETLGEKLKYMSDEEIDRLAEELNTRFDNGEELSDEELDFLYAWEMQAIENLEQQIRNLESARQIKEQLYNIDF